MSTTMRSVAQRRLVGPLILIALGVLLLLTNFGYVSWDLWRELWRYWPVLLILLGLELLISGRASWGSVLFAIFVLLVVGAIAGAVGFFGWIGTAGEPLSAAGPGSSFQQPAEGVQAAEIKLSYEAGQLELVPGTAEGLLVEGEVFGEDGGRVSRRYHVRDGVGLLDLDWEGPSGVRWLFGGGGAAQALKVRVSQEVPIHRLEVHAGAVDALLDLSSLNLQRFELDTGASRATVKFPARGDVTASIHGGASNLVLEIPQGVAARIRAEGGLSSFQIDQQRFPATSGGDGVRGLATDREFRSADFDTARNRLDLRVAVGAAGVEVR